jgi:hypothetical protein
MALHRHGNPDIPINRKPPSMHQTCLCRISALSGIAAPVVLAIVAGILGVIQAGYNPVTQLMAIISRKQRITRRARPFSSSPEYKIYHVEVVLYNKYSI